MGKLILHLDDLAECESPSSKYDEGFYRHYIIIDEKNKEDFLNEICTHYKRIIEDMLEEYNGWLEK